MKDFVPLDRILEAGEASLLARKGFSNREEYFEAHLPPSNPVVPGVYLLEGLADCVRWLTELRTRFTSTIALRGLRNAKFTRPIRPGDLLDLAVERQHGGDDELQTFAGECRLGGERIASAQLTVDVVPITDETYAAQRRDTLRYLRAGAVAEERP